MQCHHPAVLGKALIVLNVLLFDQASALARMVIHYLKNIVMRNCSGSQHLEQDSPASDKNQGFVVR